MTRFFYAGSIEAVGPSTDRAARVTIEGIPPDTDLETRFQRAPVVLWAHNHDVPVIGRARELSLDESGTLTALVEFALTPDGEVDLYGKVERGFQPTVEAFIDNDGVLHHLSLVNTPMIEERADSVREYIQEHASRVARCDDRLACCTACERLSSGAYRIPATLSKVGIFSYSQPGGAVRREFRPAEEVFDEASIASLKGVPVTIGHSGGMVNPETWRAQSVGHVEDVRVDGDSLVGTVVVSDAAALKRIDEWGGLVELSPGYDCLPDPTPGEHEGEAFDLTQRRIRYNHVSLVPKARQAGASLHLDADDPPPQPPRQVAPPAQQRQDSRKEPPSMSNKQHFPNNADPIVARNRKVLRARGMVGKTEAAREAERAGQRLDDGLEPWERKPASVHGIGGGMSGEATPAQQRQQELERKHRQDAAERAEAYRRERANTRLDNDLPEGARRLDTSRPINQPRQRWQEPANGRFGMSKDSAQLFEMNQRLARIERNTSGNGGTGGEAA